jgi:hypothetical protein
MIIDVYYREKKCIRLEMNEHFMWEIAASVSPLVSVRRAEGECSVTLLLFTQNPAHS